jgi:hypothetical protein
VSNLFLFPASQYKRSSQGTNSTRCFKQRIEERRSRAQHSHPTFPSTFLLTETEPYSAQATTHKLPSFLPYPILYILSKPTQTQLVHHHPHHHPENSHILYFTPIFLRIAQRDPYSIHQEHTLVTLYYYTTCQDGCLCFCGANYAPCC